MDDWKEALPEEMREATIIQESESLEAFAKTAISAQSMLGSSVRIPSEHASDDDRKAFTERMVKAGMIPKAQASEFLRPADAAHYKLDTPPADAADLGLTQSDIDTLKVQAHELGLSNEMFQGYANAHIERIREAKNEQRQKHMEANEALRQLWGPDAFDGNRVQALQAIRRWGGIELAKKIDDNPDPDLLRAFAEIGQKFEEQGMGDLETPIYKPESRTEAAEKLAEIEGNPDHPFNKGGQVPRATWEAAAAEVMRLKRISMGQTGRQSDFMFSG